MQDKGVVALLDKRLNSGTGNTLPININKDSTNPTNCLKASLKTCRSVSIRVMQVLEYERGRPRWRLSLALANHPLSKSSLNQNVKAPRVFKALLYFRQFVTYIGR